MRGKVTTKTTLFTSVVVLCVSILYRVSAEDQIEISLENSFKDYNSTNESQTDSSKNVTKLDLNQIEENVQH